MLHRHCLCLNISQQARCAYIVLLLTAYWVSEAIPYAVTSLFPLAFFPLAGILPGDQVGLNYFKVNTYYFSYSISDDTSILRFS